MGSPYFSTLISNKLIQDHGHYVQAINAPTVPVGEEKLRIAPTPFHTKELMDAFVSALVATWKRVGLDFKPVCGQVLKAFLQVSLKVRGLSTVDEYM